jgi:hypothetical protein
MHTEPWATLRAALHGLVRVMRTGVQAGWLGRGNVQQMAGSWRCAAGLQSRRSHLRRPWWPAWGRGAQRPRMSDRSKKHPLNSPLNSVDQPDRLNVKTFWAFFFSTFFGQK